MKSASPMLVAVHLVPRGLWASENAYELDAQRGKTIQKQRAATSENLVGRRAGNSLFVAYPSRSCRQAVRDIIWQDVLIP
ncbi:hypothetical protein IQ06DRAFT_51402 [Phaeosphaeriaceae sp. SRC1lsM3a]|nr:hypothetical protein IQ06DRAFT_51402 [Stagonospora sp. SRC1lsM3a]